MRQATTIKKNTRKYKWKKIKIYKEKKEQFQNKICLVIKMKIRSTTTRQAKINTANIRRKIIYLVNVVSLMGVLTHMWEMRCEMKCEIKL